MSSILNLKNLQPRAAQCSIPCSNNASIMIPGTDPEKYQRGSWPRTTYQFIRNDLVNSLPYTNRCKGTQLCQHKVGNIVCAYFYVHGS